MSFPEFFARIPGITLRDPLAELLGAAEGGLIDYCFADAAGRPFLPDRGRRLADDRARAASLVR